MFIKNQKGISLIEVLITVALMALVTPWVTQLFVSGLQDFYSGTKFINQQTDLNTLYQSIRHDFEMCRKVTLGTAIGNKLDSFTLSYDPEGADIVVTPSPAPMGLADEKFERKFNFEVTDATNKVSKFMLTANPGPTQTQRALLGDLDSDLSMICYSLSEKKIWIKIVPKTKDGGSPDLNLKNYNDTFYRNRNLDKPYIYYFDYNGKKVG